MEYLSTTVFTVNHQRDGLPRLLRPVASRYRHGCRSCRHRANACPGSTCQCAATPTPWRVRDLDLQPALLSVSFSDTHSGLFQQNVYGAFTSIGSCSAGARCWHGYGVRREQLRLRHCDVHRRDRRTSVTDHYQSCLKAIRPDPVCVRLRDRRNVPGHSRAGHACSAGVWLARTRQLRSPPQVVLSESCNTTAASHRQATWAAPSAALYSRLR